MTLNLVERDAFMRGKDEGIAEGQLNTLISLVSEKLISLSDAVVRSGLSEAEFLEKLNQSTK